MGQARHRSKRFPPVRASVCGENARSVERAVERPALLDGTAKLPRVPEPVSVQRRVSFRAEVLAASWPCHAVVTAAARNALSREGFMLGGKEFQYAL